MSIQMTQHTAVALRRVADVTAQALPSFDSLGNSINTLMGGIFMAAFTIGAVICFIKKEWGVFIGTVFGAIVMSYILFVPDGAKTTLTEIAKTAFGS